MKNRKCRGVEPLGWAAEYRCLHWIGDAQDILRTVLADVDKDVPAKRAEIEKRNGTDCAH